MDKRNNDFDFDFRPLGLAIKKAREAKGVTREQLANIIDYNPRHLQAVENEGQYPSIELFLQLILMICQYLGKGHIPRSFQIKITEGKVQYHIVISGIHLVLLQDRLHFPLYGFQIVHSYLHTYGICIRPSLLRYDLQCLHWNCISWRSLHRRRCG